MTDKRAIEEAEGYLAACVEGLDDYEHELVGRLLDEYRSVSAENKILRAIYDMVIDGGVVYDFFDVVEAADDYFSSVSTEQTPVLPETAIEKDTQ